MRRLPCREVQAAVARDSVDPARAASALRHLETCASCQSHERMRTAVRDSVLAADDVLDDLTRARVLARLLDTQSPGGVAKATRWGLGGSRARVRTRVVWPLAVAAAMILAIAGGTRWRKAGQGTASSPAPSPVALEPYAVHPTADARGSISSKGLDRVELPPHASMRARLGKSADLVLLGPLELAVRDDDRSRVELELHKGALIGDFDGASGRRLRISTPDATVDIVGTRFLVEASSERTRVAVEHGRVRVESKGRVQMLDAGRMWTTDTEQPEPLDPRVANLLERAARGDLAELAPRPITPPTRPPTTRPPTTRPPTRPERTEAPAPQKTRGPSVPPRARDRRLAASGVRGTHAPMAPAPGPRTPLPSPFEPTASAPLPPPPPSIAPPAPAPPATEPPGPLAPPPAPPPTIAVQPRSNAAPPLTPTTLYQRAESAFRRGDDTTGKQLLDDLVRAFPDEAMADSARFELALLAEKSGKASEALAQTRKILRAGAKGPFVEPARLLRCRVYLADDREAAALCLKRFVRDYPQSPHDDFALRALIELSREGGRCAEAVKFADLYLQHHPRGGFAGEAVRVRSRCED